MIELTYCDNCGELNPDHFVAKMPEDFDSGNAGESASLCEDCFISLIKNKENKNA